MGANPWSLAMAASLHSPLPTISHGPMVARRETRVIQTLSTMPTRRTEIAVEEAPPPTHGASSSTAADADDDNDMTDVEEAASSPMPPKMTAATSVSGSSSSVSPMATRPSTSMAHPTAAAGTTGERDGGPAQPSRRSRRR